MISAEYGLQSRIRSVENMCGSIDGITCMRRGNKLTFIVSMAAFPFVEVPGDARQLAMEFSEVEFLVNTTKDQIRSLVGSRLRDAKEKFLAMGQGDVAA